MRKERGVFENIHTIESAIYQGKNAAFRGGGKNESLIRKQVNVSRGKPVTGNAY